MNHPYRDNLNAMRPQTSLYSAQQRLIHQNKPYYPSNSQPWASNQELINYGSRNSQVNQPYLMQNSSYQNYNMPSSQMPLKDMISQNPLQQMNRKFGSIVNQDLIKDLEQLVSDQRYQPNNFQSPPMKDIHPTDRKYLRPSYNEIASSNYPIPKHPGDHELINQLKSAPVVNSCSRLKDRHPSFSTDIKSSYGQPESFGNIDHSVGINQHLRLQNNLPYEKPSTFTSTNKYSHSKNAYFDQKSSSLYPNQDALYGDLSSPVSAKHLPLEEISPEKTSHLFDNQKGYSIKEDITSQNVSNQNICDLFSSSMQCSTPFQTSITTCSPVSTLQSTFSSCAFSNASSNIPLNSKQTCSYPSNEPNCSVTGLSSNFKKEYSKSETSVSYSDVQYSEHSFSKNLSTEPCYSSQLFTTSSVDQNPVTTSSDIYSVPGLSSCIDTNPNKDSIENKMSDNTFEDNDWLKTHDIPFIADKDEQPHKEVVQNNDGLSDLLSELSNDHKSLEDLSNSSLNLASQEPSSQKSSSNTSSTPTDSKAKNGSHITESSKVSSTLEEALDTLLISEAVVGLEYIIEYKKCISQLGSFPFCCKMCNSSISRPKIIDHILGTKHRLRYLKIKDEKKYESIISLKEEQSVRDTKIATLAAELQLLHGRGSVTVVLEDSEKASTENVSSRNETSVYIPIGFEALSPSHEMDTSSFDLGSPKETKSMIQNNAASISSKKDDGIAETSKAYCSSVDLEIKSKSAPLYVSPVPDSIVPYLDDSSNDSSSNVYAPASSSESFLEKAGQSKTSSPVFVTSSNDIQESVERQMDVANGSSTKRTFSNLQSFDDRFEKIMKQLSDKDVHSSINKESSTGMECNETTEQGVEEMISEKAVVKILDNESEVDVDHKLFDPFFLENLSKYVISTDEEAAIALETVNTLMKMLLRYKLQHIPIDSLENLMKSLSTGSSVEMDGVLTMLKKVETVPVVKNELKEENSLATLMVASEQVNDLKESLSHEKASISVNASEVAVSNNECSVPITHASDSKFISVANTVEQNTLPVSSSSTIANMSNCTFSNSEHRISGSLPRASAPYANLSAAQAPSFQSELSAAAGLQPPPFFCWSQNSDTASHIKQPGVTTDKQSNMMWNVPYPGTQSQYSYYQSSNFSNMMYNNAFGQQYAQPVQLAAKQMRIVPPPPPPLPPLPCDPPLPPTQNKISAANTAPPLPPPLPPVEPPSTKPLPPLPQFQ